jgi:release factor glutamine methyltransferase
MNARRAAMEASARLAAAGIEDARFEAELLAREAAGVSRAAYFAGSSLDAAEAARFSEWVDRRAGREPAAYITGRREFFGRDFGVGPGVLIPRPETELLVELALEELDRDAGALIVEAGTGSGAVAVSVAAERPGARVAATEISPDAMRFAKANAAAYAPWTELVLGDLLSMVARADVVLANLPYIPAWEIEALEPEVSRWEPRVALDGGKDGYELINRLIEDCAARLRPRLLALEVGYGQAADVGALFRQRGIEPWTVKDLAGIDRVVCGRWA